MTLAARTRKFWDAVQANDLQGIEDAYYPTEDTYVVLEGPRYTTHGVSKIIKGWKDFCNSPITLKSIDWIEGPFEEIDSAMGWISGVTDIAITINEKTFINRFRCSFVYTKYKDDWRIKHEHVSAPMKDPYGIGDWLKT